MATILLVNDDPAFADAARVELQQDGWSAVIASDGSDAIEAFHSRTIDAVAVNVLLSKPVALAVCHHLRLHGGRTPIVLFANAGHVDDLRPAPDHRADQPPALRELVARVRSTSCHETVGTDRIEVGDLAIAPFAREVRRGARKIHLSGTEYALLELLARNAGVVVPRHIIFEWVWGYPMEFASNTLEVYIGYLRRKLEANGEPRLLQTVRSVGYVLRVV